MREHPTLEFVSYLASSIACVGVWAYVAVNGIALPATAAVALAVLCGFGPVALAFAFFFAKGSGSSLEPFHKKPIFENILHLGMGNLMCSVPVAIAAYLALN